MQDNSVFLKEFFQHLRNATGVTSGKERKKEGLRCLSRKALVEKRDRIFDRLFHLRSYFFVHAFWCTARFS